MRYCKNCGLLAPQEAACCPQCGAPLPPKPATTAPERPANAAPRYHTAPSTGKAVPALSEWATLGALLLFAIPLVGFVVCLAWSFGFAKKPARKRLAQAYLIRTLILTMLFALICVAVALFVAATFALPGYYYYAF